MRQLTVYALLLQEKQGLGRVPEVAILYPTLSVHGAVAQSLLTWNKTTLHLWPVNVKSAISLAHAILR